VQRDGVCTTGPLARRVEQSTNMANGTLVVHSELKNDDNPQSITTDTTQQAIDIIIFGC
jgi:hypothetical protein